MTPELKRFKAALLLDRTTTEAQASRYRKSVRALHRALTEPNFSRPLRQRLLKYTERVLIREESRRMAA